VAFPSAFASTPQVAVFIAGFKFNGDADLRLSLTAAGVSMTGFELQVSTWSDTSLRAVSCGWVSWLPVSGVLGGSVSAKCKTTQGWKLDKGKGDRSHQFTVPFSTSLSAVPAVFVGLSMIDIVNDDDCRLSVATGTVEKSSMTIQISTWGETKVWAAGASWIALPVVADDPLLQTGRMPFKKHMPGYGLHEGNGPRQVSQAAAFPRRYADAPAACLALSLLDVLKGTEATAFLAIQKALPDRLDVQLKAEGAGLIWGSSAQWLTCGTPAKRAAADPSDGVQPKQAKVEKKTDDDEDKNLCKICFDSKINTVLIPCGHVAVCLKCAEALGKPGKALCPICQQKFAKVVQTFAA
jgi:hypothetical protein